MDSSDSSQLGIRFRRNCGVAFVSALRSSSGSATSHQVTGCTSCEHGANSVTTQPGNARVLFPEAKSVGMMKNTPADDDCLSQNIIALKRANELFAFCAVHGSVPKPYAQSHAIGNDSEGFRRPILDSRPTIISPASNSSEDVVCLNFHRTESIISIVESQDPLRAHGYLVQTPQIPVLRQRGGGFFGTSMLEEDETVSSSFSSNNEESYHHTRKRKEEEHTPNNHRTATLELTPTSHEQARDTAQRELQRFVMSTKNSVASHDFNTGIVFAASFSERKRPAELLMKPAKSTSSANEQQVDHGRQYKRTKKRSSGSHGIRAAEGHSGKKQVENEETRASKSLIGDDDDVQPEDVLAAREEFLRRRNAFYSRRKYVRKKIEIEVMQQQSAGLTRQNDKLRQEQVFLEEALATAKSMVELYQKQHLQHNTTGSRNPSSASPAVILDPLSYQRRPSVSSSANFRHKEQLDPQLLANDSAAIQQFQTPQGTTIVLAPSWSGGRTPDQNQFSSFSQGHQSSASSLAPREVASSQQNNMTVMAPGHQQVYMIPSSEASPFPQLVSSSTAPTIIQTIPTSSAVGPRYVVPAMSPTPVGGLYSMPAPAAFVGSNGRVYPTVVPSQQQYAACPMVPAFNAVAQPSQPNFYNTAGQSSSTVLVPVLVQQPTMALLPPTLHTRTGGQQVEMHKWMSPLGTTTSPNQLYQMQQHSKHSASALAHQAPPLQFQSHRRHRHNRHGAKGSPPNLHGSGRIS